MSRQSIVVAVLGGAGALTGERAGQAGDLAGVLLLAAGTRSRRRVIESDWDHIRAAERGLLVRWAAPAQLPTGCTPEPIAIDAALLVLTGPFRRSVIVRNGNSIRSPFLVDDDALWRRVEAFAGG
ncbi:MAG: hypothetical protein KDE27_30540 [Planctomycetes bacterium]|nr:hypothetical protein [Planctomycetota bacterium]